MSPHDQNTPDEPVVPPGAKKLTVKQEREQRRLAKVAAFKKQQARAKRNRIVAITLSSVAALAVVAIIVTVVITSAQPRRDPSEIDIAGVETWSDIDYTHVQTEVDYEAEYGMNPPAGGSHNQVWLNCGVYEEEQTAEFAVHSLEHGAIWVTYNPDRIAGDALETLRDALPSTYIILSPIDGLGAPVVASGWGTQVKLDGVDDERLGDFIEKYWQSSEVPEPGASCTGAVDGPGKV